MVNAILELCAVDLQTHSQENFSRVEQMLNSAAWRMKGNCMPDTRVVPTFII